VGATATSGLPVTFSTSSAATVCTVGDSTVVAGGVSQAAVSFTGPGACVIDANQAGNNDYTAAAQVTQTVTVVAPAGLTAAFNPSQVPFGATSTLTFTVTNPNAATALAGVTFSDTLPAGVTAQTPTTTCAGALTGAPTIQLSGATLAAGATCAVTVTVTAVAVGPQTTTTSAVASTNGGIGNTATATLTVVKAPTTTTLTVTPTSPAFGHRVTVGAAVAAAQADNSGVSPTGTVSFYLDGSATPIATVALTNGAASFTTAALAGGANTVTAVYSGDTNFASSSTATATTITVSCTTTITANHSGVLVLAPGSTCLTAAAHLNGSIVVTAGSSLDVEGATITGSITASNNGGPIRLCAATIEGSVTVDNNASYVVIGDPLDGCAPNTIAGALTLLNNTHGVQAVNNHVTGGVTAINNSGAGPFPDDTTTNITGN